MTINWQEIITAVGGQIVLLGAAAWLFKALISHRLSRESDEARIRLKADADIEIARLKSSLKADTDVEIERLRSSLKLMALEHQVRFSRLHAKRAQVIADLYNLLWEARSMAAQFILQHTRDAEESQKAREKVVELFRFISLNRIYLPKSVCALLDTFEGKLRRSVVFVEVYWVRAEHSNEQTREQANKVIQDAVQALESDLPQLFEKLETEFRALLGGEEVIQGKVKP